MKRFGIGYRITGCVEVEAETYEDAEEKVGAMMDSANSQGVRTLFLSVSDTETWVQWSDEEAQ